VIEQYLRKCDWCDKEFEPTQVPQDCYDLNTAGKDICLNCCDKWMSTQLRLHFDKLVCFIDDVTGILSTFNGLKLPLNTLNWKVHRSIKHPKKHYIVNAQDTYGRNWIAERLDGNLCYLTPTGRPRWTD
jgi:hypothetical protein